MQFRPPRVGDQWELGLAGGGRAWSEPWGGRSPRELTRISMSRTLRELPPGGLRLGGTLRETTCWKNGATEDQLLLWALKREVSDG